MDVRNETVMDEATVTLLCYVCASRVGSCRLECGPI